ncbi:MAG: hypothetical protein R2932_06685 [Caldilineaceae bacterium]
MIPANVDCPAARRGTFSLRIGIFLIERRPWLAYTGEQAGASSGD